VKVFTLDPSLTAVGWCSAEIDGMKVEVEHVGRVLPPKDGSIVERTRSLIGGVSSVLCDRVIGDTLPVKLHIVIEIPSGRVSMRHAGGGAGLAKYGFAVGALYQSLDNLWGECVHAVDENWTGSRSKDARQKIAFGVYPALKRLKDPGMDISDAVALAVWWAQIGRRKQRGAEV
jgi:Holliday junction resolvasome RuvABC endonuclease subunit